MYVNQTIVDNQTIVIEKNGFVNNYTIKTIFTIGDADDLQNRVLKNGESKTIKVMGKSYTSRSISVHKNPYNTSNDSLESYPTLPNQTAKTYEWQPNRHGWVKVMHMPVSNSTATKFNRGDDLGYLENNPPNGVGTESDLSQVYMYPGAGNGSASFSSIVSGYDEILITSMNIGYGGSDGNGGIGTDWWVKLNKDEYHNWYALNPPTNGTLQNDIMPTTQHLKGGRLWDNNGEFVLARYSGMRSGKNWMGLQLKQEKLTQPSDSQYSNTSHTLHTMYIYMENNASSSNTMYHPSGLAVYIRKSSTSPAALEGNLSKPQISLKCIGQEALGDNSINVSNVNMDVSSTDSNVIVSSSQTSTTITSYIKYSVHVTVPATSASIQSLTIPLSAFSSQLTVSKFLSLDEATIEVSSMLMFIDKTKVSIQNDNVVIAELPVTSGGIVKVIISALP